MQQYSLQRVKKWYNNQYFVFKYYWNNLWVKTSVGPRAHKGSFVRTQEFLVTYRYIYYGTVNTKPVQIPVDLLLQQKYRTKGHKGPLIRYMEKIIFTIEIITWVNRKWSSVGYCAVKVFWEDICWLDSYRRLKV